MYVTDAHDRGNKHLLIKKNVNSESIHTFSSHSFSSITSAKNSEISSDADGNSNRADSPKMKNRFQKYGYKIN